MVQGGTAAPTPIASCGSTPGCVEYTYDSDGITTQAGALSLSPDMTTGQITSKTIGIIEETLSYNAHGELARQTVRRTDTTEILYEAIYDDFEGAGLFPRDDLGRIQRRTETVLGETHEFDYGYNIERRPWLETVVRDDVLVSQYAYDVPKARDGEVAPVREDAFHQRDEPRPQGIEVLVRAIDARGRDGQRANFHRGGSTYALRGG
jgi:hypothetical protein